MENKRIAGPLAVIMGCGFVLAAQGLSASPQAEGPVRFEENHDAIKWSGPWSQNPLAVNSGGGARLAMDAGAEATFTFNGASASWIGYRDEWSGEAEVFLDGVRKATVDTYATPAQAQATLYTTGVLRDGRHTLTIRAKGTRNPKSGGSWIWVDAFLVQDSRTTGSAAAAPNPPGFIIPQQDTPARLRPGQGEGKAARRGVRAGQLDESNSAATWTGPWSTNQLPAHTGHHARLSMDPAARVDFTFTGTGATWIGYRDEWSGIADVFVDGVLQKSVDTYAPQALSQVELFVIDGLENGPHTLSIQPTGRHRQASGGAWIWVDGFAIVR
jgi:hypothetical protein